MTSDRGVYAIRDLNQFNPKKYLGLTGYKSFNPEVRGPLASDYRSSSI